MKEYVLVVIKPDAMVKGLAGHILTRFSRSDLELVGAKLLKVSKQLAKQHYAHLKGKLFYQEAVDYLLGKFHHFNKVLALVYVCEQAIHKCREIIGATNPETATPTSIRGAYGRITTKGIFENLIHASSDLHEAEREIKLWFSPHEIQEELYPTKEISQKKEKRKIWA